MRYLDRDAMIANLPQVPINRAVAGVRQVLLAVLSTFGESVRLAREIEQYSAMSDAKLHQLHMRRDSIVRQTYSKITARERSRQQWKGSSHA